MTQVVEVVEPTKAARRVRRRRRFRGFFSGVMAVASPLLVLAALVALSVLVQGDGGVGAVLLLFLAIAAVFFSRWLRAGLRPHVLYLRRFRQPGAKEAITYGAAGAVGADYRLVTLDDGMLAPIGIPEAVRKRTRRSFLLGVVVLVGSGLLGAWVVASVFNSTVDSFMSSFTPTPPEAPDTGNVVGDLIFAIFVQPFIWFLTAVIQTIAMAFMATVVAAFAALVMVIPAVMVGTLGLRATVAAVGNAIAIRRAEKGRKFEIAEGDQMTRFRSRLQKYRRKRLGPRLLVARVKDSMWKEVVTAVGDDCFAALIDVTYPSEALYWETKRFLHDDPRPCLLVAEKEAFSQWYEGRSKDALRKGFRDLLRDATVIQLCSADLPGESRFAEAVRAALDDLWASRIGSPKALPQREAT